MAACEDLARTCQAMVPGEAASLGRRGVFFFGRASRHGVTDRHSTNRNPNAGRWLADRAQPRGKAGRDAESVDRTVGASPPRCIRPQPGRRTRRSSMRNLAGNAPWVIVAGGVHLLGGTDKANFALVEFL